MKVALCLSGQLRTFKSCFPSIKASILDPYKPDVFISTEYGATYNSSVGQGQVEGTIEEATELYKPKYIIVDDPLPNHFPPHLNPAKLESNRIDSCNVERFVKDTHRRYISGLLSRMAGKYDVVIRARFDLEIESLLPITVKTGLTIPVGQDWLDGINDQLAWGDHESVFWYLNLYKYIQEYSDQGVKVHPETMLKHHLNAKGINIDRVPVNYRIKRA